MRVSRKRVTAALILGIGFGLLYSLLLREIPWLQKLELNAYDTFVRRQSPKTPPNEILLVKLDRQYQSRRVLSANFSERAFYASLAQQLLDNDAAVVVLNLRRHWRDIPDDDWQDADASNSPLKNLVREYSDRIVLVTPTDSLSKVTESELQLYNHFLPHQDDLTQPIVPNSVQGFAEYELHTAKTFGINHFSRRVNLKGEFATSDSLQPKQKFDSAFLLAVKKFQQQTPEFPQSMGVNYWNKDFKFPSLKIQEICLVDVIPQCRVSPQLNLSSYVGNKIVLVGFSEGRNLNTLPVITPFGEEIPFLEFQAHIIGSLIGDRYYRVIPNWTRWLIQLVGAIILSGIFIFGMDSSRLAYPKSLLLILLGLIAAYGGLVVFLWHSYYPLPMLIPLSIWSCSAISTCTCLYLGLQKQLISNQQQKIEQLQRAEEKAVILQVRKLLQRVASDIHDTALQDLKLLMDKLELESDVDSELILDSLESIGRQIREQLQSVRQMSQKLEISSFVRSGLDVGIKAYLEQLTDSEQLTLKVIYDLHSLNEPVANSTWIDAREDIYRFFRETINNVIFHAQPPYGKATQLQVSLWRERDKCYLIAIDNNPQTATNSAIAPNPKRRISGGYGTKIMDTIAAELPEGSWSRTTIPEGGTKVQLSWNLNF